MKINNLTKTNLSEAIKYVSLRGKAQVPILNTYLFRADNDGLSITNTTIDQTIVYRLPAEVIETGQACIPKDKLSGFVASMPSICDLEANDSTAKLSYGLGGEINIRTISAKDYPIANMEKSLATIPAKKELLASIKQKLLYAVSTDMSRPVFRCVYAHEANGRLSFVATDTRCLAVLETSIEVLENISALIPAEFIGGLKIDENFSLAFGGSFVALDTDKLHASCRLMLGKFPDYKNIIPNGQMRTKINREALISALGRCALMDDLVRLNIAADKAIVGSAGVDGKIEESLVAESDGNVNITLNNQLLKSILSACDKEQVEIEFNGQHGAVVIREEEYTGMMLPVREKDE